MIMHNLTKIKIFRVICWIVYPIALLFLYPIALLRKKNKKGLFFFFDRYSIGGAQRIHLDILESVRDIDKEVYFTRKSVNTALKKNFFEAANTKCRDIHAWCDYLLWRPFTVHYYCFYLNRHKTAQVFGSNSTFFYDLLPFLNSSIKKSELLHNFTHGKNGMEFFGLANHRYLTYRFIYDSFTLRNLTEQYNSHHVASSYLGRIVFIEPGVEIPGSIHKNYNLPLKILYAGRGGAQKRIPLLNAIAEQCIERGWKTEFHFAGSVIPELSSTVRDHAVLHGEISSKEKMNEIYGQAHVILMTSAYEGFPMLIKEGMAYGCVPVVTALEGNKMHLKDKLNALLIEAIEDETAVIDLGMKIISTLLNDLTLLEKISRQAYEYAQKNFRRQEFLEKYRRYLLP